MMVGIQVAILGRASRDPKLPQELGAWKGLDSGAVDQPSMCHAQVSQSRLYHPGETHQPSTATEIPVQAEGAVRILTCHRTPTQISFSLGPPLQSGETMNSVEQNRNRQRYGILKDYLLRNGFIHYVALAREESEPFVMHDTFYGQTFEDAVDTLDP
jgi:hypothetical protein